GDGERERRVRRRAARSSGPASEPPPPPVGRAAAAPPKRGRARRRVERTPDDGRVPSRFDRLDVQGQSQGEGAVRSAGPSRPQAQGRSGRRRSQASRARRGGAALEAGRRGRCGRHSRGDAPGQAGLEAAREAVAPAPPGGHPAPVGEVASPAVLRGTVAVPRRLRVAGGGVPGVRGGAGPAQVRCRVRPDRRSGGGEAAPRRGAEGGVRRGPSDPRSEQRRDRRGRSSFVDAVAS
ncbi:hypothetical protein ACHAWF_007521, partial [Thalassiosira exigua]